MAGSNAIHRSSEGCVGVSKYLQHEKTLSILACGRGGRDWLSGHFESYPETRRKVGPVCKQREQMESPLENMTEWEWAAAKASKP